MKKNKRNNKFGTILLWVSLIANIGFIYLSYKYERKCHLITHKLEIMGIIKNVPKDITERPDYWCVEGWNNTIRKLDIQCDVLFFGHSQIAMSDFRKYFPHLSIVTSGYPGDNVEGMHMRVGQIEALRPEKIFLMCGVNSLGMSDEEFKTKYDQLVKDIQKASPTSILFIFNILPECNGSLGKASLNNKIVKRNKFIKEYAQQNKIQMIDLYSIYADENGALYEDLTIDGLHLNPEGYDRWAEAIRTYMQK